MCVGDFSFAPTADIRLRRNIDATGHLRTWPLPISASDEDVSGRSGR